MIRKKPKHFYGYKHWTLETIPRCFNVGKGRKCRPTQSSSRNHKWHAIVKRYGLRVEVCVGFHSNQHACDWEVENIAKENTFTTNHSHDDPNDIGCNFTRGGDTGGFGTRRSKEQRQRMREAHLGIPGHPQSEETRQKIKLASKGRKAKPKTREKLRRAALRENLSEETLRRRSLSACKQTMKFSLQNVFIEEFASLKLAADSVRGGSPKLSVAIKRGKPYKGFVWRFKVKVQPW